MLTALSSVGRGACGEPEWPLGRTGEGKQPTVAPGGAGARRGSGSGDSLRGRLFTPWRLAAPPQECRHRAVGLVLGWDFAGQFWQKDKDTKLLKTLVKLPPGMSYNFLHAQIWEGREARTRLADLETSIGTREQKCQQAWQGGATE